MPAPDSEAQTRARLIDTRLRETGWSTITAYSPNHPRGLVAFAEYPTANGPADYVLFHHGEPLAVVEAKKLAVGPQNVLQQAQRYAQALEPSPFDFNGFRVPFIYSTNGERIFFQDLRSPHSRSREVKRFHTPAALRELLGQDMAAATAALRSATIDHPALRPYQREAIAAVEQALQAGRRRMLVTMATGTGKTLTTIALLYRLLKAGVARRVLFLVDRRALAAQAVSAFGRFEAEPNLKFDRIYEVYSQRFRREDLDDDRFNPRVLPTSYLTNPEAGQAFVYISTIQRLQINLFGPPADTGWAADADTDGATALDIPIHAFDVIVADECHRGYTGSAASRWREVLDHFDGIKIGLTATPAAHTKAYFEDLVYTYSYHQAIGEGYLVDYDPVAIESQVTLEGTFLRPGEAVALQDRETGAIRYEELEDERELPPSDIDTQWAAPDRDRKVVAEIVTQLLRREQECGHFPKTLVFAHNDLPHISHADRLVELLRDALGRGDAFVQKITGSPTVDRPLQRIREFRNRPAPGVVVTVDMLSTGVDIPSLEAIVFLRPVRSRILFDQMMGRGTRRCDEINKSAFVVFDAVGVLPYFAAASAFVEEAAPTKESRPITAIIDDIYNNRDRSYNTRVLARRLQRVAREISGEGRESIARFIPDGDIEAFATDLADALQTRWAATMRVLRDPEFQQLLMSYPRARNPFLIAETTTDYVTSSPLIRTPDGRSVRPEDYLEAFSRHVRENPEHVEAIRILLERPADWRTETLAELRARLRAQPDGFTEERLRQAYQFQLADIISMVKHAALGEPLRSAEDRVDRALAGLKAGRTFTPAQEHWLGVIRNYVIANLAIGREDFRLISFTSAGASWKRVDSDFDGRLAELLDELNAAIAA
jgi:type I restriction enzyme, R subunit